MTAILKEALQILLWILTHARWRKFYFYWSVFFPFGEQELRNVIVKKDCNYFKYDCVSSLFTFLCHFYPLSLSIEAMGNPMHSLIVYPSIGHYLDTSAKLQASFCVKILAWDLIHLILSGSLRQSLKTVFFWLAITTVSSVWILLRIT